jgi:site-specific DNA-cytosine methylase
MKGYSFFCGAGGSTIGYKKSGIDMIGGCDIDKNQLKVYEENHKSTHCDLKDVRYFLENDVEYLHNLDMIDGSPPCTNFSVMHIFRKDKQFQERKCKEGGILQSIESLVLDYLNIIMKYRPKFFVLENVINLKKQYKWYLDQCVNDSMVNNEYKLQLIELNPKDLGGYTSRNRMFLIGVRNDIYTNDIDFSFKPIHNILNDIKDKLEWKPLPPSSLKRWRYMKGYEDNISKSYSEYFVDFNSTIGVINTKEHRFFNFDEPKSLTPKSLALIQGINYDLSKYTDSRIIYLVGMSVHPLSSEFIGNKFINYIGKY